jgi:hypothetical protein
MSSASSNASHNSSRRVNSGVMPLRIKTEAVLNEADWKSAAIVEWFKLIGGITTH